jgi:hypothetical protein
MTRVGTFVVGPPAKVDRTLDGAAADAWAVLAGAGPSTPGRTVPLRARCAVLRAFDPLTWTPGAPLVGVSAVGASRTLRLEDGIQAEQLTFTCLNAGQVDALPPGAWLCVAWTAAVAVATTSHLGGVYRIVGAARRERSGGGVTYSLSAVDWFQYDASRYDFPGVVPLSWLDTLRTDYLASGLPPFPNAAVYAPYDPYAYGNTLGGAVLQLARAWTGSVRPLRVSPWPTWGQPAEGQSVFGSAALEVGTPGSPSTTYDTLRTLALLCGGALLGYGADGFLELHPGGDRGTASGAYVTDAATPLGSLPLPWATPLVRDVSARPEFDAVTYTLRRDPAPNADVAAGEGAGRDPIPPPDTTATLAGATSESAVHPPGSSTRGTEAVVDTVPWFGVDVNHHYRAIGYPSAVAWCRAHLRGILAAADTLTFSVDPAVPPPALGLLVRVQLLPSVNGWYRLTGVTQPLVAQLAQWTLDWWADA